MEEKEDIKHPLVGCSVKGFKFEDGENGIDYHEGLDKFVGKEGVITAFRVKSNVYEVTFHKGEIVCYPAPKMYNFIINMDKIQDILRDAAMICINGVIDDHKWGRLDKICWHCRSEDVEYIFNSSFNNCHCSGYLCEKHKFKNATTIGGNDTYFVHRINIE